MTTEGRSSGAGSFEEPHALGHDQFLDEVHSFEFWFQAVEGYLSGRPYGHSVGGDDDAPESDSARDALITTLCNYCIGETAALEASSGMIGFAPNRHAKIFLATQVVDEARHLEVLMRRLADLGVKDAETEIERRANPALRHFKKRLLQLVDGKDWEAAVFAQNVILEAMEFTVFQAHAERTDPITREVLEGIIKDERRHMGFGENDLGRRLIAAPHIRARLAEVRRELDPLVLDTFEHTLEQVGVPMDQRPELGRRYLASVTRLGFDE
ncbi:MAG: ferritin-like domain-containing protein [Deltaproteobacteria bacterium]|jgi:1,2-phenylacetyl-CoA epoxidase catalytic subunit|nr:ferritin-like domain-containing protein [Deltaproteobacteria bacterium]